MALCCRNGGSIYPGMVALCRRTDGSAEPGIFKRLVEEIKNHIQYHDGDAFLISGFRGVGKTTLVKVALSKLKDSGGKYITVHLNMTNRIEYQQLLYEIIRRLYENLTDQDIWSELDEKIRKKIKIAYKRTSLNIAISKKDNVGIGASMEKNTPIIDTINIESSISIEDSSEESYLAYGMYDCEHDLHRIIDLINQDKKTNARIVIIFDELDKLTIESEDISYFESTLARLKSVITSTAATFIFIGGLDIYNKWQADVCKVNSLYASIFSWHVYVPCIWDSMETLLNVIDDKEILYRRIEDSFVKYCEDKYIYDVNEPFKQILRYINFKSKGLPRNIFTELNNYIIRKDGIPYFMLTNTQIERIAAFNQVERKIESIFDDEQYDSVVHKDVTFTLCFDLLEFMFSHAEEEFAYEDVRNSLLYSKYDAPIDFENSLNSLLSRFREEKLLNKLRTDDPTKDSDKYEVSDLTIRQLHKQLGDNYSLLSESAPTPYGFLVGQQSDNQSIFEEAYNNSKDQTVIDWSKSANCESVFPETKKERRFQVIKNNVKYHVRFVDDPYNTALNKSYIDKWNKEGYKSRFFINTKYMFNCGVGYVKCQQINKGILLSHFLECKIKPKFLPILAEQILLLVKNMHELGLFNVDLRSDNILVDKNLRIKLLDYQSLINRIGVKEVKPITHLGYTAPEVYYGIIDRRSDIYSAGILIWELINRKQLSAICTDRHIDITVLPKPELLDNDFWDIIKKAASYNPDNRYNTADDMINDIKKCRCYRKNQVNNYIKYEKEVVTVSIIGSRNSDDLPIEGSNPITQDLPNGNGNGGYGLPDNKTGDSPIGNGAEILGDNNNVISDGKDEYTRDDNSEETQFDISNEKPVNIAEETPNDTTDEKPAYGEGDPLVGNTGHMHISEIDHLLQSILHSIDENEFVSNAEGSFINYDSVTEVTDLKSERPQKEVLYSQVYVNERLIKPGYYLVRPKTKEIISIDTDSFTVGRSKEADWQIDDQGVSSVHATLLKRNNYIYIEDNNSTNGTYVNGQMLKPHISKRLKDKDTVRFGIAEVVFINNGDNTERQLLEEYLRLRKGMLLELQSNDDIIRDERVAYRYAQRLSNLFKALPPEEKEECIYVLMKLYQSFPENNGIALAYAEMLGNQIAEHPDEAYKYITELEILCRKKEKNVEIALIYAEALRVKNAVYSYGAGHYIDILREIYFEFDRNETIAQAYAEMLGNQIAEHPESSKYYKEQLEELCIQNRKNKEIALVYAEVLNKLIAEFPEREGMYIRQLREIYSQHKGNETIAQAYAQVIGNHLAELPEREGMYIRQLGEIYSRYNENETIAQAYAEVLGNLVAEHSDMTYNYIRRLREVYYHHEGNEKITLIYAEALRSMIAEHPDRAEMYIRQLNSLCRDNEKIALIYAEVLGNQLAEHPDKADIYINRFNNLCRVYRENETIAQTYAEVLGNLIAEHPDRADIYINRLNSLYYRFEGNKKIAQKYIEVLSNLIAEQPYGVDKYIKRLKYLLHKNGMNEETVQNYVQGLVQINASQSPES